MISLLSAGHHYPVHEYAAFALEAIRPNGAFIFDMRSGTGQESALAGFKTVRLHATERSARIAAIK